LVTKLSDEMDEGIGEGGVEGYCKVCGRYCNNLVQCGWCNEWICGECLAEEANADICVECTEEYTEELSDYEQSHVNNAEDLEEVDKEQVSVMDTILRATAPGTILKTPSNKATFVIEEINKHGVSLSVGKGGWRIWVPAECWNSAPIFLESKDWVIIGARHDQSSPEGSFDEYVKRFTNGVSAASYVAPILERILLIQIDRNEPNKIRLIR